MARGSGLTGSAGWSAILRLTAALGLAACGRTAEPLGEAHMAVDTLDGVVHVQHSGRAPEAVLTSGVAIGEAGGFDEASPTEFGRIRSVMADRAGRIYVADALHLEIRVFGADGAFIRSIGRKGGGPGELEGLHGTAWLGDGRFVAADFGNARLAVLDLDGRQLGQWPWMRITGGVQFIHPVGEAEFYAHGFRATGETAGDRQRVETVWVRYLHDGPADSVVIPALDGPTPGSGATCRGDGIGFFTNPHAERLVAAPAPGGKRVVAMSSRYRLAFLDPAGDTVRFLARDAAPVPLPDDEWRRTEQNYAEFRRAWSGASCDGDVRRPRHRPLLRGISFDHHGRLMVEFQSPDGPALDLYDPDLRWLATVPLPERDRGVPIFLRDDRLYLVTRDSIGFQRVETHQLTPPPS